ncbi:MAG: hypothetical protein LBS09_01870 [Bacteroidales bacterium]|jgi:outer membrane protein assembly factor BamB|nr:hypothetical protein [Bacteroidales bacterium]
MRKTLVILLVVASVAAVGVSFWFVFSEKGQITSETLYDAVPLDAGIMLEIPDFGAFCNALDESLFWKQLSAIPHFVRWNEAVAQLDRLGKIHESALPLRGHVLFSTHPIGKDEIYAIGYVRIADEKEAETMMNAVKQQLSGTAVFSERAYDRTTVTEVTFKDGKTGTFSYACRKGILMFSSSAILLESALRHVEDGKDIITKQGRLFDLIRTAGKNALAHVYIHHVRLPRTVRSILHAEQYKTVEAAANFADWTELDINLKPDLLMFNGFTSQDPLSGQWTSTLTGQQAIPPTLTDAMPPATYACLWMGIPNPAQYFSDYGTYLGKIKETGYKKELNRINSEYKIDLQSGFTEQLESECALVYANLGQLSSDNTPFALFRIKSASAAVAMLEEWQENVCRQTGEQPENLRELLQFDHQLSFTAYRFPFDIPATLLGNLFETGNTWCVAVDNYLLFGKSTDLLKRYLHYTALHASLQTDLAFGKVANDFSSRCNMMFYCKPAAAQSFFRQVFSASKFKELEASAGTLAQIPAVVYQLSVSGSGMCYNNVFLQYSSGNVATRLPEMQTSWESLLDTAIAFKPQLLQNHNTGETEVLVQDMSGKLYLLNNVGRILWKVPLPEAIISPVYQIDFYKNKKLQMLFNTRNCIYMMDRLGNMVERFPVKLPSPATGSLSLFDYENDKNYRIMVACEDRHVYAFDKTGKKIAGWQFRQSEHRIQTDICHFRTDNKDFIVFADKYRVYILDRQGKTRVSPEYNFPVGSHTAIATDNLNIVLADTAGMPHFISLSDGKIRKVELKTELKLPHFFVFQDVTGDRQGDFILAGGAKIEVFKQDGTRLMSIETDEPVAMRPYVYEFSATDLHIGIVAPQKNLIYLYNNRGKVQKGFPLTGSTLFSIGRIDKQSRAFNLFVGSKNNFIYNYPVTE